MSIISNVNVHVISMCTEKFIKLSISRKNRTTDNKHRKQNKKYKDSNFVFKNQISSHLNVRVSS